MNPNAMRSTCATILLFILAGCSSSPSEADMRAALIKQAEATGVSQLAPNYKEAIGKTKLVGCSKADAGGYKCDISNATGGVVSARFVKADGAWAVVAER
ncbi:hypothetical protein [Rugamonas sp.]|uniref:hypothetical protein n=1 Tax=Rugamonas sp. TaxID=1926287 RepID=UPI0025D8CFC5|nr:hypothetical protein [Rugamonas sp.]